MIRAASYKAHCSSTSTVDLTASTEQGWTLHPEQRFAQAAAAALPDSADTGCLTAGLLLTCLTFLAYPVSDAHCAAYGSATQCGTGH